MQKLKIPQSQMVAANGFIAQEWLVFINELIRLSNNVISSGTIEKGNDADTLGIGVSSIAPYLNNDVLSTYVAPVVTQDEQINNVALNTSHDEPAENNPYALMSAIDQQLYDQQIWGLNV